ncbi:MAG: AarF/ABC1/UbiB kinase family protein [Actinomycetota bacterium]|nr:AarF/ABC1/UbiB kinase family protein [Actinomycetota bacterium]
MLDKGRRRRNIKRLAQICEIVVKHRLGFFIEEYGLDRLLPSAKRGEKFEKPPRMEILAERVRLLLEDLGPTFIKIGQLLSVRPDLVPPEVIFELEKLQDQAPPLDFEVIKGVTEKEFRKGIDDVFQLFDPEPIASASIGQVHRATLEDGHEVVVKVQRPEAKKVIESDLDLLFVLANRVKDRIKFVDIVGVVQEFSDSLHRELDYRVEGRHADRLRFNFRGDPLIKIPVVFWNYTTQRVLTMEYIEGTKISDMATPEMLGIDTIALAEHGAKAFMKQVLVDGFFHADLHPSNIFITPDGKIAYLDFGMAGEIKEEAKEPMVRLQFALMRRDADEIAKQAQNLGAEISPDKISEMKGDLRKILDQYYGKALGEMKVDIIGREFLGLLYRHHIRIPKDYALLAKALITVEGVAKYLYPQFNIFETAKPYLSTVLKEKYAPRIALEEVREELKKYFLYLLDYPKQVHDILSQARTGEFQIKYRHIGLEGLISKIETVSNRLAISLVLVALIVSSSLVVVFGSRGLWLGIAGFALAGILFLWLLLSIAGSRRP